MLCKFGKIVFRNYILNIKNNHLHFIRVYYIFVFVLIFYSQAALATIFEYYTQLIYERRKQICDTLRLMALAFVYVWRNWAEQSEEQDLPIMQSEQRTSSNFWDFDSNELICHSNHLRYIYRQFNNVNFGIGTSSPNATMQW